MGELKGVAKRQMKKIVSLVILVLLLVSCAAKKTTPIQAGEIIKPEITLPKEDFETLIRGNLPLATEEQELEEIAKIYFYEVTNLKLENQFAIDLGNHGLYIDRKQRVIGYSEFDSVLTAEDVSIVENILAEAQVSQWEKEYVFGDKESLKEKVGEGYNWRLCLQYKDGTAFYKSGQGTRGNEIQPEGYQTFVQGLRQFVESKKYVK